MRLSRAPVGYPVLGITALILAAPAGASGRVVADVAELNAVITQAQPGETLILRNGPWNGAVNLAGKGAPGRPIVVRAEAPGGVAFGGASTLDFAGEWLTLEGVKLEGVKATRSLVVFQDGSRNCRLSNSAILNSNSGDNNWIHVRLSTGHRIDHCRFSGMDQPGMGIQFETSPTAPGDHRVDNCLFMDRARGSGNGFETVRIGYSHQQKNLARVTFDRNLFLRCNGENEIVSNKSTGNRILRNTFIDNSGELTCRHGNQARIEGNFFLRQDRGVRIIGEDHVVVNNYFADLRTDAILLYKGINTSDPQSYQPVIRPVIAFNTVVDCPAGLVIGGGGGNIAPKDVVVANNVFLLPAGPAVRYDTPPDGIRYEGNLWSGRSAGVTDAGPGLTQKDPRLVKGADGVWRPAADSPLNDGAVGSWPDVTLDLDGSPRPEGGKDVGAFEIGGSARPRKPLTQQDVGPYWMGNLTPPGEDDITASVPEWRLRPKAAGRGFAALAGWRDALGRIARPARGKGQ